MTGLTVPTCISPGSRREDVEPALKDVEKRCWCSEGVLSVRMGAATLDAAGLAPLSNSTGSTSPLNRILSLDENGFEEAAVDEAVLSNEACLLGSCRCFQGLALRLSLPLPGSCKKTVGSAGRRRDFVGLIGL